MAEHPKKLFLLDAFALIYRAYYAFIKNPRINSKGLNTSAIFGFTNTLLEVLNKQKPSHIAVVFDSPEETDRAVNFSDYKANREAMPEDIAISIPHIKALIEAFNIPILEEPGYEADDIIGTLAKQAEQNGFITYMMTPDKDFGQLVSENIFMFKPARSGNKAEILGVKEVCEKFEVQRPEQVIDILGLWGDAVDNIPGVPGVGEKTAKKLIGEYGSVEGLYENTDKLKGKLKENVENNKEQALLSKELATIILDVPVDFDEKSLLVEEPNAEDLKKLFEEWEFRRMAEQVLGGKLGEEAAKAKKNGKAKSAQVDMFGHGADDEEGEEPAEKKLANINTTPHQYRLVDTAEKREELITLLGKQKDFCFDTETTGLDVHTAELIGFSFSISAGEAFYVPVPEDQQEALKVAQEFKALFENEGVGKIAQNIKYDYSILKRYNIEVKGKLFDTMLAHYLIQPEIRHNMDVMAQNYLSYVPISIESLIGKKGKDQLSMRSIPVPQLVEYAGEDADITLQLKQKFDSLLDETETRKLFEEVEVPLIKVLAAMESEGIKLDKEMLYDFSKILEKDIESLEKEIMDLAGTEFKISSPKQVGQILFEKLQIVEKPKKTKTGQYATSEEVLTKIADKHPIVGKILDFRELQKLKSTYVDALPELVNEETGKIHTSYNQVVAVTGRLSSDHPNLQNIPIRTERGREIRKAFVPRGEGYTLLSADYSQIELRIIAELSKDEGMLTAFKEGQDIHAATAAKVFGVGLDEVSREQRSKAKVVNFGIIYGISAFGLAQRLNISRTESKEIIESYFEKYPGVKAYMDNSIESAKEKGYVETVLGRRRYLRDINSGNAVVRGFAERNAINAPIQGSAADMIKIAMINIHEALKPYQTKMLLQVHDELIFDLWKEEEAAVRPIIEDKMKNALTLNVPIEVGMGTGANWLEAH